MLLNAELVTSLTTLHAQYVMEHAQNAAQVPSLAPSAQVHSALMALLVWRIAHQANLSKITFARAARPHARHAKTPPLTARPVLKDTLRTALVFSTAALVSTMIKPLASPALQIAKRALTHKMPALPAQILSTLMEQPV